MSAKDLLGLLKKEPDAKAIRAILKALCGKTRAVTIRQTEVQFWLQNGIKVGAENHPGTWLIVCLKIEEAEPSG